MNVVWASYHDEVLHRGTWDQALVEDMLGAYPRRDVESFADIPDGEGAVVVLSARHHAADADRLSANLACLPWVVLFLTGDEEHVFPWAAVEHPNLRLWIQTPSGPGLYRPLPNGYPPWFRPLLREQAIGEQQGWFFSGQVTHPSRQRLARVAQRMSGGRFLATAGFTQGFPHDEYVQGMAACRVAPAPAGPVTPDTFRLYEALEAGAVPVVEESGYWSTLFADEPPPFPRVASWDELPGIAAQVDEVWPTKGLQCQAWWMRHKARMAGWLWDDLVAVGAPVPDAPADRVTVLLPTSPTPGCPSTVGIEQTVASVRERLPGAGIVLMCDGVRDELEHRRGAYSEYLRRLLRLADLEWGNVAPLVYREHRHQSGMLADALEQVHTLAVLFVEHDTPLIGEVDWTALLAALESERVNVIRLHHEASVLPDHAYMSIDTGPQDFSGAPLIRTWQWSQRPHLARTDLYRRLARTYFAPFARTFLEDLLHGVLAEEWRHHGMDGWRKFGVALYAPPGSIKRSTHLDARGDDPKAPCRFAYTGPVPFGAPNPVRDGERPRLGLIVRMDNRGLGTQTWELYRHLRPHKTLAIDMGMWSPHVKNHPERFPDARITEYNGAPASLPRADVDWLLDGIDVLLTAETPYDYRIYQWARELGVRTVCQPNPEFWLPAVDKTLPTPDLCVNPTRWLEDRMPGIHLPHPVDRGRLPFRLRTEARRFLHVHGHKASNDRNGTELLLEALTMCRSRPDVTIRTQGTLAPLANRLARVVARRSGGKLHLMRGDPDNYWGLYDEFDVLLAPRRYGGLSLPVQEAASAGLAILATDREPERFMLSPGCLVPVVSSRMHRYPGGEVPIESVDPKVLAQRIDELVENPALVERLSRASDTFAASISWEALLSRWDVLLARAANMQGAGDVGVWV